MKRQSLGCIALLTLAIAATPGAFAQEPAPKSDTQTSSAAEHKNKSSWDSPLEQYRLDFAINEVEDGKKINTRQYTMNVATNEGNEIKIGTRVPIEVKDGELQYLDVGTNIFARISETRGQSALRINAELSNFAVPEQSSERSDRHPIVRQIKLGGTVLLPPPARTFIIDSADDPNSKRQFQLEVTVTKLK